MIPASRRAVLGGAIGAALALPARAANADGIATVRVFTQRAGLPISPYVYGSNEIGTADGGRPSAELDRLAGVTARRFGGNQATSYNWVTNSSNAGKDYLHANGAFWAGLIGLPEALRGRPGAVIERMHQNSLAMGAISLVTLPLAGYVAADSSGPVSAAETAPSRRFVPVRWTSAARAEDPVDRSVADIPHLLRRLQARFGSAAESTGIRAYGLDNEPGLWPETHPRIVPRPVGIGALIARSVAAATAIKAIDPAAWVIGPGSWGATEMTTFQDAPDWDSYRGQGSFLAAYLDAFRRASERAGHRLLDALDVHWYPFGRRGALFRTEEASLAPALLDAPRSLTEAGFREESWVADALPVSREGGLALPLLPSLARLAADRFPGTRVAVTEFNYGGAGRVASGLALADALGRLGRAGTLIATHWGSLDGSLGDAYRLFRDHDGGGGRFGETGLEAEVSDPAVLSGFAALSAAKPGRLHAILINKQERGQAVDLVLDAPVTGPMTAYGFDEASAGLAPVAAPPGLRDGTARLLLPPRSARHYVVETGSGRLSARP